MVWQDDDGQAAKIDTTKMPTPSFKMVLTADGDFTYRTKDGVLACPIGCLKPSVIGKEL